MNDRTNECVVKVAVVSCVWCVVWRVVCGRRYLLSGMVVSDVCAGCVTGYTIKTVRVAVPCACGRGGMMV